MFKKLFTISLLLAFASLTFAQSTMLLRANGDQIPLKGASSLKEAIKTTKLTSQKGYVAKSYFPSSSIDNLVAAGKLDTIDYRDLGGNFNTNFGFFGQDIMLTWYKAHADMTIKAIGYTLSDDLGFDFTQIQFRLLKLNWAAEDFTAFAGATKQGYYPSIGDGFNEVDPFGEEATANWVSENETNPLPPWTDNADPAANTWDYDLWSDGGFPWPSTGVASEFTAPVYNWLELGPTGLGEPDVLAGEVFAIVVYNPEARMSDNGAEDAAHRIGFWSTDGYDVHDWKFYENGRGSDGADPGWWAREYTWDLVVAVDVTGDTPPAISDVTILGTTLSTEDRVVEATIVDENPGGGAAGVASANLLYKLDDGDVMALAMTASGDVFSATIPGQMAGTIVNYTIEATDVGGLVTMWARSVTYQIFEVVETNALLVFNGPEAASGYPQSYYFGVGDFAAYSTLAWDHDSWSYGALTADLVENYDNIIEIASAGPAVDNSDVVKAWLEGDASRNYMLAGDEWLGGVGYGWTGEPVDIPDGDFAKDILGISVYISDINYAVAGDEALPSMVNAVEGSMLGDSLYNLHMQVSTDSGWTASIAYDPTYEIPYDNWLDGVEFVEDVEVDMMGTGLDGNPYQIGGHRTLAAGNKIVFLAYDPLSLNSHNEAGDGEYWWYGFTRVAPQVQALDWFGASVIGVEEDRVIPKSYELSQNYPNPFNPTTVISYSIPEKADVTLTVFNLLGQNVATLASGVKNAGTHEASFNARNLSSGVYFYTIQAGSFTSTKKMMLLK